MSDNDDNNAFDYFDDEEDDAANLAAFQASKEQGVNYEEDLILKSVPASTDGTNLVPFSIVPFSESNAVRPEYAIVDNVSYYNHVGLAALTYGQVTQGIKAGAIYDAEKQRFNERRVEFDF